MPNAGEIVKVEVSLPKTKWDIGPDTPMNLCPTSYDLNTNEGKVAVINAKSPGNLIVRPNEPLEMVATNYLIYPDKVVNEETGELEEICRTVLFDQHGNTFVTSSEHFPDKLRDIENVFGPAIWSNGIRFSISERRNRSNTRTYHDCRIQLP